MSPSESSFVFYDRFGDLDSLVDGGNLVDVGVLTYAIQVPGHQGHLGMHFDELCGNYKIVQLENFCLSLNSD